MIKVHEIDLTDSMEIQGKMWTAFWASQAGDMPVRYFAQITADKKSLTRLADLLKEELQD